MKQRNVKKHSWLLGLLVLFCLLVYSCLHDDWGMDTLSKDGVVLGSNRELTASEAERWYNANNPPIATVRALNPTDEIQTKPKWSGAIESRKGKFEVVEIPLLVNGSVVFMDDETKMKTDREENLDEIRNLVRMVVIKNLETSEVCSFIMAFVGTYDYLIKKNTLLKNSYLHREPDFEGSVYFYKSGQRLVNGWRYKAGKIVARISPGTEEGYQIFTRSAKTRMMSCSEEVNWINENRCWGEPYWDQEFGMGVASVCEKHSRPDYHTICVEEDDNGREPGAWDEGGGGGYDPPTKPDDKQNPKDPCDKAKALSADAAFKSRLNTIYNQTFPYRVGNTEHGFIQTSQGETINPSISEAGRVKYNSEQFAGKEFLEWYHSHPDGGPITSLADLKALATQYQQGHIKSGEFTYGIVSEFGSLSIMISSTKDFEAFAASIRSGELDGNFNSNVANGMNAGTAMGSIEKLALFLSKVNSGLSLLFRPIQNDVPNNWAPMVLDSNANLTNVDCN